MLDIKELPYAEIFRQIREAVSRSEENDEDVDIFVDGHEFEQCMILKGFVENMLGLGTKIEETCGFYILRITRDLQAVTG